MSGDVGRDRDQAAVEGPSSTTGDEAPWILRSLSGNLRAMPVNSRSMPHLPFAGTVEVAAGQSSTVFEVDPVSRRSLSSLQSATWRQCGAGALRLGVSLSSVAVDTPLTSSASSAATTAGGGGGSDVSGGVPDSFDDDELPHLAPPPPPSATATSHIHNDRFSGDLPSVVDDCDQSRLVSGTNSDRQCPDDTSTPAVCVDEGANSRWHVRRLQQQKRQRRLLRRQRRLATGLGHPSSNSLDDLQRRTPPKLVQSSASLTSAPGDEVAAAAYCYQNGWKSTGRQDSRQRNSQVVDGRPLPNCSVLRQETSASKTSRSSVDWGLRRPDARSQDSTPHGVRSLTMTTTWLANRAYSTVVGAPRYARNAWSKSQEIHPKTGGGGHCSLQGSANPVRRRNSLHAVFVDDTRTAILKDVVISTITLTALTFLQFN